MDKKQELSQLSEVAANAKRKGHFGRARNVREQMNDLAGHKKPRKAAAKKTAAKKTAAKKTTAKKTAAKKS